MEMVCWKQLRMSNVMIKISFQAMAVVPLAKLSQVFLVWLLFKDFQFVQNFVEMV